MIQKNDQLSRLLFAVCSLSLEGEEWREIECESIAKEHRSFILPDRLEGIYFISNYGRVLSIFYQKPMIRTPQIHKGKYYRISINNKTIPIHRIVADYFIGDIHNLEVHHKNTNSFDNNAQNLEILTQKEHAEKHKKEKEAQQNGGAKPKDNSN